MKKSPQLFIQLAIQSNAKSVNSVAAISKKLNDLGNNSYEIGESRYLNLKDSAKWRRSWSGYSWDYTELLVEFEKYIHDNFRKISKIPKCDIMVTFAGYGVSGKLPGLTLSPKTMMALVVINASIDIDWYA